MLAGTVLTLLCLALFVALRAPLGPVAALSALTPLLLFLTVRRPGTAWVLTKIYFGVMWLCVLGFPGAAR